MRFLFDQLKLKKQLFYHAHKWKANHYTARVLSLLPELVITKTRTPQRKTCPTLIQHITIFPTMPQLRRCRSLRNRFRRRPRHTSRNQTYSTLMMRTSHLHKRKNARIQLTRTRHQMWCTVTLLWSSKQRRWLRISTRRSKALAWFSILRLTSCPSRKFILLQISVGKRLKVVWEARVQQMPLGVTMTTTSQQTWWMPSILIQLSSVRKDPRGKLLHHPNGRKQRARNWPYNEQSLLMKNPH